MGFEELPSDLIFDILTRVSSLKTLDTCKSVCKLWNKLIHEPKFMPLNCQRTGNLSGYFVINKTQRRVLPNFISIDELHDENSRKSVSSSSSSLVPDDFSIMASCNQGILCCLKRLKYYTCKPATQQWQLLPSPDTRNPTAAMAIMVLSSSPLRYKIVRLSKLANERSFKSYNCEIFDSKTWTWKETQDVDLEDEEFIPWSSTSVSTSNSVYWLTSHNNVLTFHEPDETFKKFQLPNEVVQNTNKYSYKYKKLVECQGKLGLIICDIEREGETELWITDENSRNGLKWSDKMVMNKGNIVRHKSYDGFYHDAMAFLKIFYDIDLFQSEDGSLSEMEMNYKLKFISEFFRFRSDLEPVNLGSYINVKFGLRIMKEIGIIMCMVYIPVLALRR